MSTGTNVTVLSGGSSHERDVALAGAAQVVAALRTSGYQNVRLFDTAVGVLGPEGEAALLRGGVGREPPTPELLASLAEQERAQRFHEHEAIVRADVVFLVLHGPDGEGGSVQTLLDHAGIPYTGSGPLGSMLAMDKDIAKRLMRDAAIPTPDWTMWPADSADVEQFGLPVIVKPSKAGSTVGLTLVKRADDIPAAVDRALAIDNEVLLERFMPGRELTVGVLDGEALAVGEILPSHELFDYECKYTPGLTREIFPADISPALATELQALAAATHRALKLRDVSRVDFRLDHAGRPQCLEANTIPGLTSTSLLPQSAAAAGVPFAALCARLVELALRRRRFRNKVSTSGEL